MEQKLPIQSLYCGLIIFAFCFVMSLSESLSGLLIFSNVLPGFIYGLVISGTPGNDFRISRLIFTLLSGGLFIFVAWVATGYSFFGGNMVLCFPLGSMIGAMGLLALYYLLIDRKIAMGRGLLMAFLIGLLSSALPLAGDKCARMTVNSRVADQIFLGATLLIIPVWQGLFGWMLYKLKRDAAIVSSVPDI